MKDAIKKFIDDLANAKVNNDSINHYSLDNDLAIGFTAQINLLCFLITMRTEIKPKTLLLGEAPGYKGCSKTGVPFTSEAIISSGKYRLFNYGQDSQDIIKRDKIKIHTESTATIVWDTLDELNIYPLLWNAYPFTPFDPVTKKPNRKPTRYEVENIGRKYFRKLIEIFPIENFVSVGKVAEDAYRLFGIKDYESIRHPSFGGKSDFIEGLKRLKRKKYF